MKNIFLFAFPIILFCVECTQQKGTDNIYADSEKIFHESMRIHDEVMPKMGEIIGLQSALKSRKKELVDQEKIDRINQALQELENAHNGMMQWMRNVTMIPKNPDLNDAYDNLPSAKEMIEIQEESLAQVKKVHTAILNSMQDAKALIKELDE